MEYKKVDVTRVLGIDTFFKYEEKFLTDFVETDKMILRKLKGPSIARTILEKNKWCWDICWITTCMILRWDPSLIPYTNINSKWIKDVRTKAVKLLFFY